MNLYCCANFLKCQQILILRIGHSRFAIYLCVDGLVGVYAPLCASVVNPPNLVAITEKNQAVPTSALRLSISTEMNTLPMCSRRHRLQFLPRLGSLLDRLRANSYNRLSSANTSIDCNHLRMACKSMRRLFAADPS